MNCLIVFFLSILSFAYGGNDSFKGLQTTLSVEFSGESRKFIFCEKANNCKSLGSKEYYSISDLEFIKEREFGKVYTKSAKAAGAVVVGAGVVYFVGLAGLAGALLEVVTAGALGSTGVQAMGAMAAMLAPGITVSIISDSLNPLRQYEKSNVISEELMSEKVYLKSDKEIRKFAQYLDEILL